MDIGVMSVRYARALLKCAMETKIEEAVYRDMQALSASYLQVPQLQTKRMLTFLMKSQGVHLFPPEYIRPI